MASVFKRKRRVKQANGKIVTRKSKCWYFDYTGSDGIAQRVKGYTDQEATKQMAARLKRQAERCEEGLVDKYAKHARRPLREHLGDFREYMAKTKSVKTGRYRTKAHVEQTVGRIERVFDACGFRFWKDIDHGKIEMYLGEHVADPKTHNHFVTAIRQFAGWMIAKDRAGSSPVEKLSRVAVPDDEFRRALSSDEVSRLLETTEAAPTRFGMTGHERAVLYLMTIETGLRVRELRSLTVSSFDFDKCVVTAKAEFCKNRKRADQLIKYNRAAKMAEHLKEKTPDAKAFDMPGSHRTAKMLRADLEKTGIPFIDDAGRKADFHCLRHTLATALDQTGASLKERMTIMRHSDRSNLTLGTYTHTGPYNLRLAIENLPDYPWPGTHRNHAVATGTDGKALSPDHLLTGKWTGKRTETTYPDSLRLSSNGTATRQQQHGTSATGDVANSLNTTSLETEIDPVSASDTEGETDGCDRNQACDQRSCCPITLSPSFSDPCL